MKSLEDAEADTISVINDKQEVTYNELRNFASANDISEELLKKSLEVLEKANAIASRNSGGILTYYLLSENQRQNRIFIVEDDKNINRLMALSVGKGFDISQIYDGNEALKRITFEKPDLVVLDLMLPGIDGLELCQTIKRDPNLSETVVIIVSAMDATASRFKGIKYGADYYIKKPFDPDELRTLVTIFLKKKGKKFDPLIDLPNEERISDAVETIAASDSGYEIGKLKVEGLAAFAIKYGNQSGITILRLVSQLLQDKVKESGKNVFIGFLDGDNFVVAGNKIQVNKVVNAVKAEFNAVSPFIYQNEEERVPEFGMEGLHGVEKKKLTLSYSMIEKSILLERRAEILKNKEGRGKDIGSYTYEELMHMLGSEDLDITFTRDPNGVRLSVGKNNKDKKSDNKKNSDIMI